MKYPKDMIEFWKMFGSEEKCYEFLELLRWPDGVICESCGGTTFWKHKQRGYKICTSCKRDIRATAGTIFQDQRVGLQTLFLMCWLDIMGKQGVSAAEIARILPISQPAAWAWLQKLRKAMVLLGRTQLSGHVEVDEIFIGGYRSGKPGRGAEGKQKVIIAVEVNRENRNKKGEYRGMGRVRMKVVPSCGRIQLHTFIKENIQPGSTLYTDNWFAYRGIEKKGYIHKVQTESSVSTGNIKGVDKDEVTPNVHIVASLLKRWLLGTHQQYMGTSEYLQDYLEEYTFRYNRRESDNRGKLFATLMYQIVNQPKEKSSVEVDYDLNAT